MTTQFLKAERCLPNKGRFQVGGSLPANTSLYVSRQADQDFYDGLRAGEFCYVLNSRQMGKSSLRVQTMQRLQAEGFACAAIDLTQIGSQHITPEQWYAGIIRTLVMGFGLPQQINLRNWWRDRDHLSPVQRLSEFLEEILLPSVPQKLIIFVDEIDSILSLSFSVSDFFALIRDCYNRRADKTAYRRLTFALLGVATPSDLIPDKRHTPFNIGRAIELKGFQLREAQPLLQGLTDKVENPQAVLKAVLDWTGGQPFLTQKLCQFIAKSPIIIPQGQEIHWVNRMVQLHILDNWESQDEPEHLRTIRDRLLLDEQRTVQLLTIYQQIIQQGEIPANDSPRQMELRLSGLVVERGGKLRVCNRIYAGIFNQQWVNTALKKNEKQIHHHLITLKDDLGQRRFVLNAACYSIGRAPTCDIRISSPFASRHHATLVQLPREDGTYFYRIVDGTLQGKLSANGLLINGQKQFSHDLRDEDVILLGSGVRLVYCHSIGLMPEKAESTLGGEIETHVDVAAIAAKKEEIAKETDVDD
jgi:pSer/pThr/pTyr-binding forkhead associated (FHA) protein